MLKVLRNVNIHKSFLSLRAAVPLCEPLSVVFLLLLSLNSCSAQAQKPLSPSTDFYEGLKKKQAEVKTEAVIHFEKALDSPNVHAAAAAAAELMSLHYSGTEIRAETIRKIRTKAPALASSKAAGSWAMVLDAPPAQPKQVKRVRPKAPVMSYRVPAVIPKNGVVYQIQWGDTLWDISAAFYRNPWLYHQIAKDNKIRNPDLIIAGSNLRIYPVKK